MPFVLWWHTLLEAWSSKAILQAQDPAVVVYTDAASEIGCRACWGNHWLQLKWTDAISWIRIPITHKEVLPSVLACTV